MSRFTVGLAFVVIAGTTCALPTNKLTPFGVKCESDRDCAGDYRCNTFDNICVLPGEGEGDGKGGEGEGEGGGDPPVAAVIAFCTNVRDTCMVGQLDASCEQGEQNALDAAAGQGDPVCTRAHDAELALITCLGTAACAGISAQPPTACTAEFANSEAADRAGGGPCFAGNPPGPPVPAAWTCPARFFGQNDGCDCGCGALDTDCTNGTCLADADCATFQTCDTASGKCAPASAGCIDVACRENACRFCYDSAADATSGTTAPCDGGEGEGEGGQ